MTETYGCAILAIHGLDENGDPIGETIKVDDWNRLLGIFGPGWSFPTTVSGNTSTGTINSMPNNVASTGILYRRNTHDDDGSAKQLTPEQEELWKSAWKIATMTSLYGWKSAEEIANDANDYHGRFGSGSTIYHTAESTARILEVLFDNGLVEKKIV